MTLTRQQKRASIAMMRPALQQFAAAVADMRASGASEPEIEALIENALALYPDEADPEIKSMMADEMKRAARPQHEAPGRLQ